MRQPTEQEIQAAKQFRVAQCGKGDYFALNQLAMAYGTQQASAAEENKS